MRNFKVAILSVLLYTLTAHAGTLTATQASSHIGEHETVCGVVASAHFAARSRGNPTFLNLDRPYPEQVFTILIWGSHRYKFGYPELQYSGRRICVTGEIQSYRGVPEIVATEPAQISVQNR